MGGRTQRPSLTVAAMSLPCRCHVAACRWHVAQSLPRQVRADAGIVERMPGSGPRSLADQLRSWPDERLRALLVARPDLATPAPQDSAQLASRAATRASVMRAVDQLDRCTLTTLEALGVLGGRASAEDVSALVNAAPQEVRRRLRLVRDLALVWGEDEDLRLVSAVGETLAGSVNRLGQPLATLLEGTGPARAATLLTGAGGTPTGDRDGDVAQLARLLRDPRHVDALLAACDAAAHAMLTHLEEGGTEGRSESADHEVDVTTAVTPVEQLLARALLVPRDRRHLSVPREVVLSRRGGRTTREPVDLPPQIATSPRSARLVERAAAGAAYELVHRVELVLDRWGEEPPGVLRQGGLAVRDLKALTTLLHADEPTTALCLEVAFAAGLVTRGSAHGAPDAWLPTDASDAWRAAPLATRWAELADAWLETFRLAGLVGRRREGRTVNALAPDLDVGWAPDVRRATLAQLATLDDGVTLAPGAGLPSLVSVLHWLRPRRPASRDEAVGWTVHEAAVVGVTGLGGMTPHGRALLDSGPDAAARAVDGLLPRPVDHVVLQADLTAVAPGPLEGRLARDLATVAHVESRGGATVYRFTEGSVRHAFDLGWSAAEVHDLIAKAARTEVPQPLRYLVDDVARTFGTVRLGVAESFVRSDDETALTALVNDPRAVGLGLRRIAPTVLVSAVPADLLLPMLREVGLAPVVEDQDGVVRVSGPARLRAPVTARHAPRVAAAAHAMARAAATATAIRAGDRVRATRAPSRAEQQTPASALALLREAAESSTTVVIGYVDDDGTLHDRVVDPLGVEGGRLKGFDHRSDRSRSFAVHRIKSVRHATPDD
jgi:hypothetical protein